MPRHSPESRLRMPMRVLLTALLGMGLVHTGVLSSGLVSSATAAATVGPQVVNGRVGDPAQFPALVAIADRDRYAESGLYDAQVCGGTAVTTTLIITAAHCVVESGRTIAASRIVAAHTPSGALTDANAEVNAVATITVYPGYNERTQVGDIAVVRLRQPLAGVVPMLPALPAEDAPLTVGGASARVAGWGATTSTGRNFPDRFRVGDLTVFPRSACGGGRDFTVDGITFFGYGRDDVDPEVMICAEGVRDSLIVDSCIGDSGGPLIAGTGDERRLVGVVSWGPQRCASMYSGVYTRVSAFTTFLRAQGVPFAPTPSTAPDPPTIVDTSITPTTARIAVAPAPTGARPTSYRVTAQDASGATVTCSMPAPAVSDDSIATCTLTNLRTARRYTVTAIALTDTQASEPSASQTVRPADRPLRPRISDVVIRADGVAQFSVVRLNANGSPFTRKVVVCAPIDPQAGLPRRSGDIRSRGIAVITGLSAGTEYTCRARVANALGSQRSSAVTLRAR